LKSITYKGEIKLRKKSLFTGLIAISLFFTFSLGVFASPKLSIWFNNKAQKVDIKMFSNKPYVPLNDVVSWFGGKVTYDKKTNVYKVTSKDFDPNPVKSFNLNVLQTSGPVELKITKVTLNPTYKKDQYSAAVNALVFDIQVSNTNSDKISIHPAQGIYALNTGEQIDDVYPLMYSDNIGGDFLGGAVKKGRLIIPVKGKLDQVNSVHFNISGPFDDNLDRLGNDLDFDVKFR
jgi:hypothetical protein